jgi:hypothetical protein
MPGEGRPAFGKVNYAKSQLRIMNYIIRIFILLKEEEYPTINKEGGRISNNQQGSKNDELKFYFCIGYPCWLLVILFLPQIKG